MIDSLTKVSNPLHAIPYLGHHHHHHHHFLSSFSLIDIGSFGKALRSVLTVPLVCTHKIHTAHSLSKDADTFRTHNKTAFVPARRCTAPTRHHLACRAIMAHLRNDRCLFAIQSSADEAQGEGQLHRSKHGGRGNANGERVFCMVVYRAARLIVCRTSTSQILPGLPDLGEPINAIVSGLSDESVLNVEGFLLWATSINFGVSCLGQANGSVQLANLGAGNQTQGTGSGDNGVLRWNYMMPYVGTCKETFIGGNHFRWFKQESTGAYFLAASIELDLEAGHMIAQNGYNAGRDELGT